MISNSEMIYEWVQLIGVILVIDFIIADLLFPNLVDLLAYLKKRLFKIELINNVTLLLIVYMQSIYFNILYFRLKNKYIKNNTPIDIDLEGENIDD